MKSPRAFVCTTLIAVALLGCSFAGARTFDEELMLIKASALTKVAAALESTVRFKGAPEGLSEDALKSLATQHDPELLEAIRPLVVRVRRIGVYSSALVCTEDGRMGLMEDAGCTARLDGRFWDRLPPIACEFQLELWEICAPK